MKKVEFLQELENSLHGHLSQYDIDVTLSYYRDIFDSALADGKGEDEVSERIGSPAKISQTILNPVNDNGIGKDSLENTGFNRVKDTVRHEDIKVTLASMSRRLGAYVIDKIFIWVALTLTFFVLFNSGGNCRTYSSHMNHGMDNFNRNMHEFDSNSAYFQDDYGNTTFIEIERRYENPEDFQVYYEDDYPALTNNGYWNSYTDYYYSNFMGIPLPYRTYQNLLASLMLGLSLSIFLSNIFTAIQLLIFKGYTFGKYILGIKVVHPNGKKLNFLDVTLREVLIKGMANWFAPGILNIISFVIGCNNTNNKTIHDSAANTIVIRVRK